MKRLSVVIVIALLVLVIFQGNLQTQTFAASTSSLAFTTSCPENVTVYFLDVGQGDSILVKTPSKNVLIDGGPTEAGATLLNYLSIYQVTKIDLLIATHPHEDHIGGLISVMQSTIPIQDIVYNGYNYTATQTFNTWKTLALTHNLTQANRNQVYAMSPTVNFTVLSPTNPLHFSDINAESIVMRLRVGNTSVLLTGDATIDTEASMLASGLSMQSQVLKVGHHGSSYSTSQAFLTVVQPNYAVISAGINNQYGHPTQQTLDSLSSNNIITYGTYKDGTIILSLNSAQSSGTLVSGIISSNTTWAKAASPYNFTGNVLVDLGATLTIESGVTVNFNGYFMNIGGTLSAKGTEAEKIIMTGSGITYSGEWKGRIVFLSTRTDSTIENAEITSTPNTILGIYSSPTINKTILGGTTGTAISIIDGSPIIVGNIISNNSADGITVNAESYVCSAKIEDNIIANNTGSGISIYHGAVLIQKNKITNNYAGIYDEEWWGTNDAANITENIISNNHLGIQFNFFAYGSPYAVTKNIIIYNFDAIRIGAKFPEMGAGGSGDINNNTISKNTNAIVISDDLDLRVNYNNIYENTNYCVWQNSIYSVSSINASYNWWGTINTATINQLIYDFYDDFNLGKVTYDPFLTNLNPVAPTIPTFNILASTGSGGSINPSGIVNVTFGSNQSFTLTPDAGYQIINVLIDGIPVSAPFTFSNIINGHTIYATFAPNPTPTPSPSPSPTPSPSPSPSPTPSPTADPTQNPTTAPTQAPTSQPTANPTTNSPTQNPITDPTVNPTPTPTVPELPSLTILMILVGLISICIVRIRKKADKN